MIIFSKGSSYRALKRVWNASYLPSSVRLSDNKLVDYKTEITKLTSEWNAVYANSIVDGYTDDGRFGVARDRRTVEVCWQEFEAGDKHTVSAGNVQRSLQTEGHEYIDAA